MRGKTLQNKQEYAATVSKYRRMKPTPFQNWKTRGVLLCCLLCGTTATGQPPRAALIAARRDDASAKLTAAIDAVLDAPDLQTGFVGACVVRVRDNQVLYARNADRVFLPASNNKLLTSFAALETLPLDFAYHTQARAMGTVGEDGVLRGNLMLVGGGDPLLSLADLDDMAQQIARMGLREVSGKLIYDDTRYDAQWLGDGWTWDDEAASYSAQISALNVNGNCIDVQVLPGKKIGQRVRAQTVPATGYIRVENTAITGASGSRSTLVVDRKRGQNVIPVTGRLPLAAASAQTASPFTVAVTVENPPRFTATLFGAALRKAGVHVDDGAIVSLRDIPRSRGKSKTQEADAITTPDILPASDTSDGTVIAEHTSIRLPELLTRMNKPSDNLMAECLLKAVGAYGAFPNDATGSGRALNSDRRVGTSGNSGTGAQLARKAFGAAGMNLEAARQVDGSGLSRGNYVSPHNLVRLLLAAHARPYFPMFYASLPIAGVDGTLRNRMKNTPAANNCHAKTGSLSHVSSLSGYVRTRDGEELAFSLLMNHQLGPSRASTRAQDSIAQLLAAYPGMY